MPDIKGMLDSIIDGANNKFPNTVNSTMHQNMGVKQPQTFDAGKFREKLSMYVLKDIISAMMHDETKDLDGMIDQSIMQHIRDEYGCGCYGYLCKARDKANPPSPLLSDIVQEVEDKTERVTEKVAETQDDEFTQDVENMKNELPGIENYEELRKKLKDIVSRKVVDDVAKEITKSNAVPVFDDLDDKLAAKTTDTTDAEAETGDVAGEDVQSESVIMNICTTIITEAAAHRIDCTFEQGFNLAVIEYCMAEMDYLFKMDPTMTKIDKWQQPRPITESFFERIYQESGTPDLTNGVVIYRIRQAKKNYESYFAKGSKHRPTDDEKLEYRALYDALQSVNHPGSEKFKHPGSVGSKEHSKLSDAGRASMELMKSQHLKAAIDHWSTNFAKYTKTRSESFSEKLDRDLKQNGYREYATDESSDDDFFE